MYHGDLRNDSCLQAMKTIGYDSYDSHNSSFCVN